MHGFGGLGGFLPTLVGGAFARSVDGDAARRYGEKCTRGLHGFHDRGIFSHSKEQFLQGVLSVLGTSAKCFQHSEEAGGVLVPNPLQFRGIECGECKSWSVRKRHGWLRFEKIPWLGGRSGWRGLGSEGSTARGTGRFQDPQRGRSSRFERGFFAIPMPGYRQRPCLRA